MKAPADGDARHPAGDEAAHLGAALEAARDEIGKLTDERTRLRSTLARMSADLQRGWAAQMKAAANARGLEVEAAADVARHSQTEEDLRAASDGLHALMEELELTNADLRSVNTDLDRRVADRTKEFAQARSALGKSEARFRTLVEGMPQLVWRANGSGEWTWCSPQWIAYTGLSLSRSLGFGWLDAVHTDDRPEAEAAWRDATPDRSLGMNVRIYNAEESRFRHFRSRAVPVRAPAGAVIEWLGTSTDVNDLIELQQRQSVLLAELQHRTRNLMAVVRSTVNRTFRGSDDLDDFQRRLEPRLAALSRVQGLLSRRGDGERVNFDVLLRAELAAHVDLEGDWASKITLEGPSGVTLRSAVVQIFALGMHELATNALKYGALSADGGHLTVRWRVDGTEDQKRLHVVWDEIGVPGVGGDLATQRKGYGRELIERALPYQLGARTTYDLRPDGVHCVINAPLGRRPGG